MQSFAHTCLLAATAMAYNLNGSTQLPAAPQLAQISPLSSLIESIETGFSALNEHNELAEDLGLKKLQDEQNSEIDELMEEANELAAEIIESESDASDAAEEVEEINDEVQEDIKGINKSHDRKVAKISKKSVTAKLTNDIIMENVIDSVLDVARNGGSPDTMDEVIEEAGLPFPVKTPNKANESPNETMTRMVCRNGECVESVKNDPEFDTYLEGMIGGFGSMRKGTQGLLDFPDNAPRPF